MVDDRNILKSKLEEDLKQKLQDAQKALEKLQEGVRTVEANATKAKESLIQEIASIHQLLKTRKMELSREIDIISHKQICSLQKSITELCRAIGSIEGSLTNMDNLDLNQLAFLRIPEIDGRYQRSTSPLQLNMDGIDLTKEILNWGSVSCKGLSGFFDAGTSTSALLPDRYVDYQDKPCMDHKPVSYLGEGIIDIRPPPKLPLFSGASAVKPMCSDFDVLDLEELLTDVKLESGRPSGDMDFELVTAKDVNEDQLEVRNELNVDEADETDLIPARFRSSDVSGWVKSGKRTYPELADFLMKKKVDDGNCSYAHDPLNNRYVEFPCLQIDAIAWVAPSSKRFKCFDELELPFPSMGIIPSELDLPPEYWVARST